MLHDAQGYGASALRPFEVAAKRVARPFRDAYDYVSGLTSAKSENAKLHDDGARLPREALRELGRGQENANLQAAARTTSRARRIRRTTAP